MAPNKLQLIVLMTGGVTIGPRCIQAVLNLGDSVVIADCRCSATLQGKTWTELGPNFVKLKKD